MQGGDDKQKRKKKEKGELGQFLRIRVNTGWPSEGHEFVFYEESSSCWQYVVCSNGCCAAFAEVRKLPKACAFGKYAQAFHDAYGWCTRACVGHFQD